MNPAPITTTWSLVIERYPELRANDTFLNLQQNLVDTEQRIALARGYFNSIATFYNIRLQVLPDRFICALGMMKPQALMCAGNFERVDLGGPLRRDRAGGLDVFVDASGERFRQFGAYPTTICFKVRRSHSAYFCTNLS